MAETTGLRLKLRDLAEIVVGSCVLAFPVAVTEEVWGLSETLGASRVVYLSSGSFFFIGLYIYQRYYAGRLRRNVGNFALRVLAVYFVTMGVSATILLAIDKLTTVATMSIALKRVVIVAFPASFAATVVDGMSDDREPAHNQ